MLDQLAELSPARAIADSIAVFAGVESLHIMFIAFLGGCVLVSGLAGVGAAPRGIAPAALLQGLRWPYRGAIAGAAITGALLFATSAQKYLSNPLFTVKLILLASAIAVQVLLARSLARPGGAGWSRLFGIASLLLWLGAITAGRWIGLI